MSQKEKDGFFDVEGH